MSLDFPDRKEWLAIRDAKKRRKEPRYIHISKTWNYVQVPLPGGFFEERIVWNPGITYFRPSTSEVKH